MGKWLARNATNLIILAIIFAFLTWFYWGKSLAEITSNTISILLVITGLALVIFIHELGHFLAAKACDVRVQTFSLGFGPPIPGLHFKWGETYYKVAAFPLGGYVQMLGEDATQRQVQDQLTEEEEEGEDPETDPRSFKNKTVLQRMFIISAGVVMNTILGLVCFIIVYTNGKPEPAPQFRQIVPGGPADRAGIQAGSKLLRINEDTNPTFIDLLLAVAFSTPNETELELEWETPAGERWQAGVRPQKSEAKPVIGVFSYPPGLILSRSFERRDQCPAEEGTPAAKANFRPGDRLVAVEWRDDQGKQRRIDFTNSWDLFRAEYESRGRPAVFYADRNGEQVSDQVEPRYFRTLGLRMKPGPIRSIGADAPSEVRDQLQEGDVITSVLVDGKEQPLDPMRLPDLVMAEAIAGKTVELKFDRQGQVVSLTVPPDALRGRGTWNEERPLGGKAPLISIPALAMAYEVQTTVVEHDAPAGQPKLQPGDVIKEVILKDLDQRTKTIRLQGSQWPLAFWALQEANTTVQVKVLRQATNQEEVLTLEAWRDERWPLPDRGFLVEPERVIIRAADIGEAVWLGFKDTKQAIGQIFLGIRGLVTQRLSPRESVIGPIGIAEALYRMAERGWTELLMILGQLSISLAVINLFPIPVLDGGHLLFLGIEGIRGRPVSERTLGLATLIGLVLILSLMAFVIYLDLSRLLR